MPLTMATAGKQNLIQKVGGRAETRQFLENLGFVAGSAVTVVHELGGSLIVSIRDSRVALSRDMASKIFI